jgi:uncharacterized membrane protein
MSDQDTLLVLGASYDTVEEAIVDYEAVKDLFKAVGVGHEFDAAVIEREADGKVNVKKKHEQSTHHGAWEGLAIGAVAAILPGIGLAAGAAVGAGVGAVAGHLKGGISDGDLHELGSVLNTGQAGLVVVYATNMADQVAENIKTENKFISSEVNANADELAQQLKEAEGT